MSPTEVAEDSIDCVADPGRRLIVEPYGRPQRQFGRLGQQLTITLVEAGPASELGSEIDRPGVNGFAGAVLAATRAAGWPGWYSQGFSGTDWSAD